MAKERRFQYGLRTLFVLPVVVALLGALGVTSEFLCHWSNFDVASGRLVGLA